MIETIDEDRTLSIFGTDVRVLTKGSHSMIVAVCEGCGKVRVQQYQSYRVLCRSCVQKGKTHSAETRRKIAAGNANRIVTAETRRKLSEAGMGRASPMKGKTFSEETRRKMSVAGKKKMFSEEHRHNLSEAGKGRIPSEETRRKLSKANKGKTISEENRCKVATANANRIVTDETRRKMSKSRKGMVQSEESIRKRSATRQGIPYDQWEAYATAQPYCPKFDEVCRESNRNKYGNICFLCGKPHAENVTNTGKVRKLSVHHVDMQKSQGCGHDWKLVPLCMNCHGMTHTLTMASRIEYVLRTPLDCRKPQQFRK